MLEEQEIGRELLGYKKDDVDRLLAELHRELRIAREEAGKAKKELETVESKLSTYEGSSTAINKTMIDSEKVSSEIIEEAKEEAQLILTKAKSEASNIVQAADTERDALESEFQTLSKAEEDLERKIEAILNNYVNLVKEIGAGKESPIAQGQPIQTEEAPAIAMQHKAKQIQSPLALEKALVERLTHLADIQGVGTCWIFDTSGIILSSFNRLKIDLAGITSALGAAFGSLNTVRESIHEERIRLAFIELDKLVLITAPLTSDTALAIMASVKSPIGQILWYLDKEIPELQKLLS